MFLKKLALIAVVCLCYGLAPGCGGDPLGRQAVSGTVNVNGAPLEKGSINFHPMEKGVGSGTKIEGGKYAIASKDGLPVGKYRVSINAPVPGTPASGASDAPPGEPPPPPQEYIPDEWNTKSEHTVEIKSGKNEHNFDVQAKKK